MFGLAKSGTVLRDVTSELGLSALLIISTIILMGAANAQGLRPADLATVQSGQFETGEQLVLSGESGTTRFAGHNVQFSSFSGIVGFASDVAYIVALEGKVAAGPDIAERGEMLLFPPMGGSLAVERFDAARFRDGWTAEQRSEMRGVYASLDRLADKQSRLMFWGRLGPTNFNVAVSGAAKVELARRTIVGDDALREIRFQDYPDRPTFDRAIVNSFTEALVRKDVKSVAAMLDPEPYGNTDLRGGGGDARIMMAEALIAERDWSRILRNAGQPVNRSGNIWIVDGEGRPAFVTIRALGDVSYIRSIRVGG